MQDSLFLSLEHDEGSVDIENICTEWCARVQITVFFVKSYSNQALIALFVFNSKFILFLVFFTGKVFFFD
ncbi:hypothetical protein CWB96_13915 [Pseudoalteromonas citrea]|uniref:Uncharacterized protein n=1 Tax=Pseudoalteromonas citrea TaxID=43655 RepID=A0A5S3XPH1_9GAMM|nr:hypothetical protein CWB97_20770 [Pseudoalteromonas citrea]TMP57169.1 hypothetical protein CWB96_13915 [Pseudoalteromonas citrea]